ncbi:unnamed protein product [Ixodes hexagonus]
MFFYSYHLVHFLDDGSTYVVPEWWLVRKVNEIIAYWPPHKQQYQVLAAIRQREQITRAWSNHPIKIIHSYATLQPAINNIDAAANTSNLDSDGPDPTPRRLKIRRTAAYVESSGSDGLQRGGSCSVPVLPLYPSPVHLREGASYHDMDSSDHLESAAWNSQGLPGLERPFQQGCLAPQRSSTPLDGTAQLLETMKEQDKRHGAAMTQLLDMLKSQVQFHAAFREAVLRNQADQLAQINSMRQELGGSSLTKVVDYFARKGGGKYRQDTRGTLAFIVKNDVAGQCSWKGSLGQKQAFYDLKNIMALLLGIFP